MTDKLKTYDMALDWLFYGLPTSTSQIFQAEKSYDASARLFEAIDNPQNDYPTIHIAGTSGKGSAVALASDILLANDRKVGSIYSPHVYDFRERFLINGDFVDKSEVLEATIVLKNVVESLNKEHIFPSYFQATIALAYLIFANHQLDYLVIETGLGGLYDATNHIVRDDKVVLLNSIGLDHTEVLGDTIEEIAFQKAGIISDSSTVFAINQSDIVNKVFAKQAELRGAKRFELIDKNNYVSDYSHEMRMNMSLAVNAIKFIAERDGWSFEVNAIEHVATNFNLPGRFEVREMNSRVVILDGAHNLQKTEMLLEHLKFSYPEQKFNIAFATSKKRDPIEIIELLEPVANKFFLTKHSVFSDNPERAAIDFSDYTHGLDSVEIINNLDELSRTISDSSKDWLVTGSFFLVSDIGRRLQK